MEHIENGYEHVFVGYNSASVLPKWLIKATIPTIFFTNGKIASSIPIIFWFIIIAFENVWRKCRLDNLLRYDTTRCLCVDQYVVPLCSGIFGSYKSAATLRMSNWGVWPTSRRPYMTLAATVLVDDLGRWVAKLASFDRLGMCRTSSNAFRCQSMEHRTVQQHAAWE